MPDEIKFAFVLDENLNLKSFKVPQAIVKISVEGAEDPLTHQQMRDAVHDDFLVTQKKVNDFIKQRNGQLAVLGVNARKAKAPGLVKTGNETIQRLLADFEHSADATLKDFVRANAEKQRQLQAIEETETWRNVRWGISVLWTGGKALVGLGTAVVSGGTATPLVINEIVSNLMDLKKLFEDLRDKVEDINTMRVRVKQSLTALKSKPRFTNSDVEAFANELKLYEAKLLALEVKAKAISSKINPAITAIAHADANHEATAAAQKALDESLKELVKTSQSIKTAETYISTMKKNLGAARAQARTDPTLTAVKSWALTAYTKINDYKDIFFEPDSVITWIDQAIKRYGDTRSMLED